MSWYFLRPRGPLLTGDGRSFGSAFHRGSIFPTPQAVLGAARARAGEVLEFDWDFAKEVPDDVRRIVGTPDAPGQLHVGGVFLASRRTGQPMDLRFPRPADLLVFPPDARGHKKPHRWHPLRPDANPAVKVSAPSGLDVSLAPLAHQRLDDDFPAKPVSAPPGHLPLDHFTSHLRDASSDPFPMLIGSEIVDEPGIHVSIDDGALTASEGGLFSVARLSFAARMDETAETGLAVEILGGEGVPLDGTWRLGGKGSLVDAFRVDPKGSALDTLKAEALRTIASADGRLRWVLVTPARFRRGWLPDFLDARGEGTLPHSEVRVRLRAAAVERPFAYSGWDLAAGKGDSRGRAGGGPRPTRLFAPAGSVYFFEVLDGGGEAAARAADAAWLRADPDGLQEAIESDAGRKALAIDSACGLGRGVFGPWEWFQTEDPV